MYLWCFEHIYKIKKGSPTFTGCNSVTVISDYECLCFFLWFFNRSGSTDRFRECRLCDVCCASYTSYFVVRPQSSDSSIQGNTERNSVRETTSEGGILPVRRFRQRVREFRGHNQLVMNAILENKNHITLSSSWSPRNFLAEKFWPLIRGFPRNNMHFGDALLPVSSFLWRSPVSSPVPELREAWWEGQTLFPNGWSSNYKIVIHWVRILTDSAFFVSPMSQMKLFSVPYWVLLKPTKQHTFLQRHINVL